MVTIYRMESKGEKLSDFDKKTVGEAPRVGLFLENSCWKRMEELERTGIYQGIGLYLFCFSWQGFLVNLWVKFDVN